MHGLLLSRVCSLSSAFFVFRLSSRKYEPLTQGDGLNPNHDGSSTERDVPNEFCVCCATNHAQGSVNSPHSFCPFVRVNMAEEELTRCAAEQRGPQGESSLCLQRTDRTSDHCQELLREN